MIATATLKQVLLIEVMVIWEDLIEEVNERKWSKYQELVEECREAGWKAHCKPFEVGCRVFTDQSLCKVYTLLGITGAAK